MSDPVTNAEVEDVLSSIRRLVSEDKRPMQAPRQQPSGQEGPPDRLVLTPALRVADTEPDTMPAPAPEGVEDHGTEPPVAADPVTDDAPVGGSAEEPRQPAPGLDSLITDDAPVDVYDDAVRAHREREEEVAHARLLEESGEADADDNFGFGDDAETGDAVSDTDDEHLLKSLAALAEEPDTARHETAEVEEIGEDWNDTAADDIQLRVQDALAAEQQWDAPEETEAETSVDTSSSPAAFDAPSITQAPAAGEEEAAASVTVFEMPSVADEDTAEPEEAPEPEAASSAPIHEMPAITPRDQGEEDEPSRAEEVSSVNTADSPQEWDEPARARSVTIEAVVAASTLRGDMPAMADDPATEDPAEFETKDPYAVDEMPSVADEDLAEEASVATAANRVDDVADAEVVESDTADGAASERGHDEKSIALSTKIAALETAIGKIAGTWEPDDTGDSAYAGTEPETMAWEDDEPEGPETEPMPTFAHRYGLSGDESRSASDDETPQDAEAADAPPAPEADDTMAPLTLSAEEQLIDEEMLRDLVSEIVRSELQGPLGERITRNVRKLVRREIHRALAAQELE